MKIYCEDFDQCTVVTLQGEFVSEDTRHFRREASERLQGRTHDFVADLSKTEFVDSAGLETLVWLQDQCAEHLGQVRLAACSENVRKILEMTRLAARFDFHESVEAAVQSLR